MTLSVDAHWTDEDGVDHALPIRSSLAGVEATRQSFYGCPQAIAKGLRLLPRLRDEAYIEIGYESFGDLLNEINQLEALAREAGTYASYWRTRLDNLRAAIAAASARGPAGKVTIG